MKKFNINSHIYIQITEKGWQHLKRTAGNIYVKHCIKTPSHEKTIDGKTWYRLQAHQVFDLLSDSNGSDPLYLTDIMFDDEALEDY